MMVYELKDIAILNIKGFDYRCIMWNMSRSDAINRLNNSKLDVKGSLNIMPLRYGLWCEQNTY